MDWTLIITTVVSAICGGGIATYFNYRINNRKEDTNEFSTIINEYKRLLDSDKVEIARLSSEVSDLKERDVQKTLEIQNLKHQLIIFESSHIDIPLPCWLKDTSGKVVFLNKEYESTFLIPRGYTTEDYIGKNDFAVWDEESARGMIKNDKEVVRTKRSCKSIEQLIDADGEVLYVEVLKYPRKFKNTVVGIGGLVLRKSYDYDKLTGFID
tara:strand:+ start:20233 stop:20865 length:633 start_codon:yes stop_codon:yes gene_type:complete